MQEQFDLHIDRVRRQIAALHLRAEQTPAGANEEIISDALLELDTTLEKLQVAEAELSVQQMELEIAAQGIENAYHRYLDLFQFAPDGYLVTNADGKVEEANRAATAMLNVSQGYLIGKPIAIFIDPEDRRAFRTDLASMTRNDRPCEWELRLTPKEYGPIDVAVRVGAITDARGARVGYRWMLRDISERKRAEKRIHALNLELDRRVEEKTAALETALASERQARTEGESDMLRLRFLLRASETLSSSLDYETTLKKVVNLVVPDLADWCAIDIMEREGSIKRVAATHVNPAKIGWLRELMRLYPPVEDAPNGVPRVLRSGVSEFIPEIPDAMLMAAGEADTHFKVLRSIGFTSAMIIPLVAHDAPFGAITFGMSDPTKRFTEKDLSLAEELARRVSSAVDNSRLHSALQHELNERRQAEEALRVSEDRYRLAMQNTRVAVFHQDRDLRYTWVDKPPFGLGRSPILGKTDGELFPPDVAEELTRSKRKVMEEKQPARIEITSVVNDTERTFDVSLEPLCNAQGTVVGLAGAGMEITERKEVEKILKRYNEELEKRVTERTTELRSSNHELESFAYSVSHDLWSPLRAIDGYCFALLEDHAAGLDANGHDFVLRMRSAAQRMGETIENLLTLSRIMRWNMRPRRFNMSLLARTAVNRLRQVDPERNVEVVIRSGMTAVGDIDLVSTALRHLFENAWKFTSNVETAKIVFDSVVEDGRTVFRISDNGAGFSMKFVHKLFKSFQRLHTPHEFPGSGIGLAIVDRVIRRHGGTIRAEGIPYRGATFHFELGEKLKDSDEEVAVTASGDETEAPTTPEEEPRLVEQIGSDKNVERERGREGKEYRKKKEITRRRKSM